MSKSFKDRTTVTMTLKDFQELEQKANGYIDREDLAREIEKDFDGAILHDLSILLERKIITEDVFYIIKKELGL